MEKRSKANEKLARDICRYLTDNMESRITLKMLSEKFHISGTSIKCAFKSTYGESIYAYIRKQKMLSAAKELDYNNVIAVFQPFTFSRTALLKDDFIKALSIADKVILTPIMGSREKNTYGIKSEDLAAGLHDVCVVDGFENIADKIEEIAHPGDLVITMGGGDIYKAAHIIQGRHAE